MKVLYLVVIFVIVFHAGHGFVYRRIKTNNLGIGLLENMQKELLATEDAIENYLDYMVKLAFEMDKLKRMNKEERKAAAKNLEEKFYPWGG